MTGLSWKCPLEKVDECLHGVAAAMRSAPEEDIAKELYRLRILTRGREQRSQGDREAEAVIWLENLRCWPGDIVIDVLRNWPNREDGQWWPTWHDVDAVMRYRTSTRQAIMTHLAELKTLKLTDRQASSPVNPDARAKVQEMMDELAAKMKRRDPPTGQDFDLSPEQELEMMAGLPVRTTNAAALIETLEKRKEA
jgi:hypothetical protein